MNRLERLPVPILPTFVGALTLSNVYSAMGYPWIRHMTMWAATVIFLLYLIKLVKFPSVCKKEYEQVVSGSLYAGFPMILMILGSYYREFFPPFGKGMWVMGLCIHGLHILVFTYRNVIRKREKETFLPSWFVTYNGILVGCIAGANMGADEILKYIVYYGIVIYFLLLPLMIFRLLSAKIKEAFYHTMAVLLSPCSLCVVSYLNVIEEPDQNLLFLLYGCVLASLLFVILKLPAFFSFSFTPGFAGMTFPMAIGIVASTKMAACLKGRGLVDWAGMVTNISGIQIYLTSMIIGYVLMKFLNMALKK